MSANNVAARDELLAAVGFNDAANACSTPEELVDAYRLAVIADRDAQIIAWLEQKAREEGTSNKDSRLRATAIYRMADKLSRGAVRPPLSKGPDTSAEDALTAIRTAVQADDMPQVRRLIADHYAALRGAEDSVEVSS